MTIPTMLLAGVVCVGVLALLVVLAMVIAKQNRQADADFQAPPPVPTANPSASSAQPTPTWQQEASSPATAGANIMREIMQILAHGNKIEAIKVYRQATGAGLKEAKEAVEALGRGEDAPALDLPAAQPQPGPDLDAQIKLLLAMGNKLEAIKLLRIATGAGLKEAKDAVEALDRGLEAPAFDLPVAPPQPGPDLDAQIKLLLAQGAKLEAIKLFRAATGAGLKEAKDAVERIEEAAG